MTDPTTEQKLAEIDKIINDPRPWNVVARFDFTAVVRQHLPWLVSEVRRLQREVDRTAHAQGEGD